MLLTRIKRFGRIIVFITAIALLAVILTSIDKTGTTVDAASLKHIDEIVAQSGTFNILEIVPDRTAASIGYYIDGQEPVKGWKTAAAGQASPADRSTYVNSLFGRLADKSVLGSGTDTPLRYTYYDSTNHSYYTETYVADDPENWSMLHLNTAESAIVTGTMTPAENGAYRANYTYTPIPDGGYVQDISIFEYTDSPDYGSGVYYYNPVFTEITVDTNLDEMLDAPIYIYDETTDAYRVVKDADANPEDDEDRNVKTVQDIIDEGGFEVGGQLYYYSDMTQTGAPGEYSYAAFVSNEDADDAPGDGFTVPPTGVASHFSRTISSYIYVGTGGNTAYFESGATEYTVIYTDVYYKAGFANNNLLKTHVFGLDAGTMNALNVTVTVRLAGEVTAADISAAGLIYLSTGADITQSGVDMLYTQANDIPDARAVDIYNFAANQNAVIIDHNIIEGVTQATPPESLTNIQKLCLLSLQSGISTTTETSLSALTVDWATLAYMTNDVDKTLVNNNVYLFKAFNNENLGSSANISWLVTPLWNHPFSQSVYSDGFTAVLAEIEEENFLRTIAEQQNLLTENVTVSASVRHIINYKGRRETNPKTAIRVLDLEPAKVTSSSWLTAETVRGWINDTLPAEQINIVHMTTGEFNGKIEDLSETYDMIYIGASIETMNKYGGATVYNNTAMEGLIYSNIGDIYYATIEMAGIRNQDYLLVDGTKAINNTSNTTANRFRFSGNDITKTAVKELEKYVQAGYPIILADGLFDQNPDNPTYKQLSARVDNSSYMFQSISDVFGTTSDALSKNANVMTQNHAANNNDTVIQYMNVSKPSLILSSKPVEYANDPTVTLTTDPNDGFYYLSYVFSISNVTDPTPISTTYDCKLSIDLNADGRYSVNEELGDIAVYRVADGELSDGTLILPLVDQEGHEYYALSADVAYRVTRQMPGDYAGIIPWKLAVVKNGADHIHASAMGFTRIDTGGSPKTVKVLQIMQAGTAGSELNLSQQLTINPSGTNPQLRGLDGNYYTGIYGKLIADLRDFNININMIENDDLEAMGDTDIILSYLNNYDMLIIGFNDCYNGIGSKGASAIVRYISGGKSVLFTHDTTSLTQVPSSNYPMAINGTAPKTLTLSDTDVLYNSSASEYRSINGKIYWSGGYSTTSPPYVRQYASSTYVVLMDENIDSANEDDYWTARAGSDRNYAVYQMSDGSQITSSIRYNTSLSSFKSAHPGCTVIYVYSTDASGWYGTRNFSGRYNLTTTNNFTKFAGGTRYTCTGMTYYFASGRKPMSNYQNLTLTDYDQIMKSIYYSKPNTYTIVGTYNASTDTYSIGGTTYWPATGMAFPQETLYDRQPSDQYQLSTIPDGIMDWGYYFNTVIRDTVGLDRYGVTSSIPVYDDTATLGSLVNVTAPMPFDSITTIEKNDRSVAFAPNSFRASTVNEYQGYTNYALIRFAGSGNTYRYTANNYSARETTMVSQVNKGQITTYPYNVNTLNFGGNDPYITAPGGSYMQIGNTHEQYFQINMNTDDIVVWYCMSNANTNGTINDSSYYDDVPNDCVNAYYIYNKNNVTYSGVGHSSNASLYTGSSIGQQYINEAKLFVNTMIAAYQSGEPRQSVKIVKDAQGTTALMQKFFVYDEQYAGDEDYSPLLAESFAPTDESRAVYFRVYDPHVEISDPDKKMTIVPSYYVTEDEFEITADDAGTPIVTYNADGTPIEEGTSLKGGHVYKFYLPNANCLDYLKDVNTYSIKVSVKITTKLTTKQGETTVLWSTNASLYIKKQQLFPLA